LWEIPCSQSARAKNTALPVKKRALVRPSPEIFAISLAQLNHQMLEMRRGRQRVWAQGLPQPFAYAITDRSAGLMIDLLAGVGDSAVHIEFRIVRFNK
jgi:hypothetical protein